LGEAELQQLAGLSQAARQDELAARLRGFLENPAVTVERVKHSAAQ
jgi:hypothetical protein